MNTLPVRWYKQFWPWALIALPASAVIASLFTAYLAAHKPDALVADDYYKAGLAINKELAAQRSASQMGINAQVHIDTATSLIFIELHGNFTAPPDSLLLRLIHPTLSGQDLSLTLNRHTDGHYSATWPMQNIAHNPIRWQALLTDTTRHWEISTHITLPQQSTWQFMSTSQRDAT